jgi:hypothetical protein
MQFKVLGALEEQGWPEGPVEVLLTGSQLKDTVKDLQNRLNNSPIQINRDGNGRVIWSLRP